MPRPVTEHDLEAYLDEALAPEEMAEVEKTLRAQPELVKKLAQINGRRDRGLHSLGEIWRRHRIGCPTREQLGSFLLGVLADDQAAHLRFHVEVVGCRFCRANLEDLRARQQESDEQTTQRRRKYFQSSAGYLRGE